MSKRSKHPYPNLKKNLNTKVRQELIDYDYIDKLSDEEKAWLNQFTGEYLGGNFKKAESGSGNYSTKNFHRSKKARKDCYDRNNHRNNDIYSITKGNDMLKNQEVMTEYLEAVSGEKNASDTEDNIIKLLDVENLGENGDDTT